MKSLPAAYRSPHDSKVKPCTTASLRLFFPRQESNNALQPTRQERRALALCAQCHPGVREACLERQIAFGITGQSGISGGTTAVQRQALIRLRAEGRADLLVRVIDEQLKFVSGNEDTQR
ncbi:WhiB family transcriptional regulator [Kitasatospora sp. NPDC057904]|uniref:WhiB family transcriptional regulator n=1 Tax=unclassified Kitasatospora TaxID=2633591 RepID=UPI0036DE7C56